MSSSNLRHFRINEKLSILRERDAHIANLEAEINEIVSKLNLLQNEKGKLMDNEAVRDFNAVQFVKIITLLLRFTNRILLTYKKNWITLRKIWTGKR